MDNKITTLLFDLDGTLIDTNEFIIKSFLHTLRPILSRSIYRKIYCHFIGPTLYETFSQLNPKGRRNGSGMVPLIKRKPRLICQRI